MTKYTVTKKPLTANTIWDAKIGKPLCRFDKGVIHTDDDELATKLEALGHTVTENADADKDDAENPDVDDGSSADGKGVDDGDTKDAVDQNDGADADKDDAKHSTGRRNCSKSGK